MLSPTFDHPAWCDPMECDADPDSGRGCHQARPMSVSYDDRSRSSASVLVVKSPGETRTWICVETRTVDVQGALAEHSQLLTPEQARLLGRHLLRAGQEATAADLGPDR
ncbi:MAG TPA: hypothetical protein VEO01_11075 [Pseudonocardiaceae bacterium]|nr:hypothetical protein [Pseudonocardiaceae bacterium]